MSQKHVEQIVFLEECGALFIQYLSTNHQLPEWNQYQQRICHNTGTSSADSFL
jgi:hypothetical protein